MATQEELDWKNTVSKNYQRETRERRRAIKAAADAALEQSDVNFNEKKYPLDNKQDYNSDIQQRGIDQFTAPEATPETSGGGGGGLPAGFAEETLDVVNADNTAGQRAFLTKAV